MRFSRPKNRKFPVFFPVSREFSRRRVSARLRAPPDSLKCREIAPSFVQKSPENSAIPQFRNNCLRSGLKKMALLTSQPRFLAFLSEGQIRSPVSATPLGEYNAITNPRFGESSLFQIDCLHQWQIAR
jgi:hypothetical protein